MTSSLFDAQGKVLQIDAPDVELLTPAGAVAIVCRMRAPGHHHAPPGFPTTYAECLDTCMTQRGG